MAFRSGSATTASGTSGVPTVNVPAGAAAGDIVLFAVGVDDQSYGGTFPTGFTQLVSLTSLTGDGERLAVAWKRLTGADTGTYAMVGLQTAPWAAAAIALTGRHATNPPVISANASNNTGNVTPVAAAAAAVTALAHDDVVYFGGLDVRQSGVGNGATPPAGFTELADVIDGGLWSNIELAIKEDVAAGTTGTATASFALTGGGQAGWGAWQIRIPKANVSRSGSASDSAGVSGEYVQGSVVEASATPVATFDGLGSDEMTFTYPHAHDITQGPWTLAALVRRPSFPVDVDNTIMEFRSDTGVSMLNLQLSSTWEILVDDSVVLNLLEVFSWDPGGHWVWVVVTNPGDGSTVPRWHAFDIDGARTWLHGDSLDGNPLNFPTALGADGVFALGVSSGGHNGARPWDGATAITAAWAHELTDSQVAALSTSLKTSDLAGHAVPPKFVHELTAVTGVTDVMGNGFDQVGDAGPPTLTQGIARWDFDGAGGGGGPGNFTVSAADTAGVSETLKATHVVSRALADTTSLSDAAKGLHATSRAAADSTSTSDAAAGLKSKAGTAAESLSTSDAVTALHVQAKGAADSGGGTDAARVSLRAISRAAADSASVSDAASKITQRAAFGNERLSQSDAGSSRLEPAGGGGGGGLPVTDGLSLIDSFNGWPDGTDLTSLGENWGNDVWQSFNRSLGVWQEMFQAQGSGDTASSYWDDTPISGAQRVTATYGRDDGHSDNDTQLELWVCYSILNVTGYRMRWFTDGSDGLDYVTIEKTDGSAIEANMIELVRQSFPSPLTGDVFALDYDDSTSTVSVMLNTTDNVLASIVDTDYTVGTFAIGQQNFLTYFDDVFYGVPTPSGGGGGAGVFSAIGADSVAYFGEAAAGVHAVTRAVADSATVSEAARGLHATTRTAADSGGGTDTASGGGQHSGTAADTLSTADAAVGVHAQSKAASDTAGATDAAVGLHATARAASDTTSTTDAAVGSNAKQGTAGDAAGGSDAAVGLHAVVRAVSDSATVSDAAKGLHATARGAADATSTSDAAVGHVPVRNANASDAAPAVDTNVARHSTSRSVGDSATLTDSATGMGQGQGGASDSAHAVDAVTSSSATSKTAADAAGGTDAGAAFKSGSRSASDSAGGADVLSRTVNIHRGVADSGGGTDVVVGIRGLFLSAAAGDVAHATDAVALMVAVTRAAADAAPATDGVSAHAQKQGAALDVASVVDVARAIGLRLVGVFDTAPATDVAGMARSWAVFATDHVPVPVDVAELMLGAHGFGFEVLPPVVDGAVGTWYRTVPELQGKLSAVLVVELASVAGVTSATLVA